MPALRTSHLSMLGISSLLQSALQDYIREANLDARKETTISFKADELMKVAHFNLSLANVTVVSFFAGLIDSNESRGSLGHQLRRS